ncbi:hypothetical protein CE195_06565 [Sodalis-like symbiont of Philaenus spumarius]|nr:hypothetical protein CE195_06565 [Sodalis-like symbiont of Philaenus spumarius]
MITVSVHCPRCHSDEIYHKFHLNGSEDNTQKL